MKRKILIATGFLACPCHLPLWLALLGGSAVGGAVAAHQGLALIGMTATFVIALALAFARPGRSRPDA